MVVLDWCTYNDVFDDVIFQLAWLGDEHEARLYTSARKELDKSISHAVLGACMDSCLDTQKHLASYACCISYACYAAAYWT